MYTIVTGSTRGIGLEVCRQLALKNKSIILTARNIQQGQECAETLKKQVPTSAEIVALQLDVSDPASIKAFSQQIADKYSGKIECLVNNAGILEQEWSETVYNRIKKTNLNGPIKMVRLLAPHMADNARIVNVSSCVSDLKNSVMTQAAQSSQVVCFHVYQNLKELNATAQQVWNDCQELGQSSPISGPYPATVANVTTLDELLNIPYLPDRATARVYAPAYSVSKLMLNRATQIWAEDESLTSRGITVLSVCPGWVRTDMGTQNANRSVEEGAGSVVWGVLADKSAHGTFTRDGRPMEW